MTSLPREGCTWASQGTGTIGEHSKISEGHLPSVVLTAFTVRSLPAPHAVPVTGFHSHWEFVCGLDRPKLFQSASRSDLAEAFLIPAPSMRPPGRECSEGAGCGRRLEKQRWQRAVLPLQPALGRGGASARLKGILQALT